MDVRNMNGNPRIWEKLSWEDMSSKEQELWSILGWQQYKWNKNDPPPSSDKAWGDLSHEEQRAASGLGFTQDIWDNFEDE